MGERNIHEWADDIRLREQNIEAKAEMIANLRSLAEKATSEYTDTPRNPSPNQHRTETILVKMLDLEDSLKIDFEELIKTKTELLYAIEKIETHKYRKILALRYAEGKTWNEISAKTGYSKRHIQKLDKEAIKEFEKI
jgi:DNA-directed RNA polymerase specialized sigma subunit